MTTDLNNLAMHSEYDDPDDIVIGDGSGLSITRMGSTKLSTPSNTFSLSNVLCVPSMGKQIDFSFSIL